MWSITGQERRVCPPEYQSRIREIGGINRFGEPNWRVVWGQTQTERVGGLWEEPDGTKFEEMRDILRYDGQPCWALERWFPPENYGSEWRWYMENADPNGPTHLPLLGGYPDCGDYEPCKRLSCELNDNVIDFLIMMILKTHETTAIERQIAIRDYRAREQQEEHDRKVERYVEACPAYSEAVAYAGQKNHTARIDRIGLSRDILKNMPNFGQIPNKLVN